MRKRLIRCVSLMLVLCMLWTLPPSDGLAGDAPDAPAKTLASEAPVPEAPAPQTLKTASATPTSETATASEAAPKETAAAAAPTPTPATEVTEPTPTATAEATEAAETATPTPEAAEPTPTATEAAETATPAPETPTPKPTATPEPDITLSPETPTPRPTVTPEPDLIFAPELLATPTPTVTPTATPEATPSATPSATPTPEPVRILSFDLSELPEGVAVPYGTEEAALGLPEALTASFSDGTIAPVAVTWTCVSDGLGGTAYNPMPEAPAALFTFQAALAQEIPCDAEMPTMGVVFMDMPMLMAAGDELTALGISVTSADADFTVNGTTVDLTSGTFNVDNTSTQEITINVNGATLTAAASVNGDVKVSSGHADLKGANALTVDSGSATVTGSVSTISVSDGTGSLHAESATLGGVSVTRNNTGEIVIRNSTVGTLNLYNYQGKTEVSGSDVKKVSFGGLQSYREAAGEKYWPKQGEQDRLPAAGEVASELRVELNELILPRCGLTYKAPFTLVFVPWDPSLTDGRYPSEANKRVKFNVCLYDKNGNDTSSSTVTILQSHHTANYTAPLTLTGGSVTKTYDGTADFTGGVVKNATWTKENWDGTVVDYTGVTGDVTVPDFAVAGKDVGTYTYTPETLTFPTAPAGTTFASAMPTLTAEITKAPVTLSGTFGRHYFPTTLEAVADQLTIDGLAAGDTVADLGITKLTDDTGRDLLDNVYDDMGKTLDVTKVECATDANYEVTLQNLRMIVYYLTLYNVEMPDACVGLGAPPFPEPVLTLDTSLPIPADRPIKYEYAKEGTEDWSETPPTETGTYQIRVTLGAYDESFTEEVGMDTFRVQKTDWNGKAMYPVEVPYGDEFKVQLQLIDYNDGVLPYQQYGYIEVDFEGQTYRGEYDAAATDGYPFTATIPTEGKTTKIGSSQVLPVRFYLPKTPGGTDYELVFTREAYVTVVKGDIAKKFTVVERTDGPYIGLNNGDNGARIEVEYAGSPSMNLTDENTFEISITRNGAAHTPLYLELSKGEKWIIFKPRQAGEYELTVRLKDGSSPFYAGSLTVKCTVARQKLVIHADDATMERGKWFDDYYSIKEGALAGGDVLKYGCSISFSECKKLPVGEHRFTLTNIRVTTTFLSKKLDVTDSYELSQYDEATGKDHEAILTVTPKKGNFTIVIPSTASISDGSMTLGCTAIDAGLTVGVTVQSANDFTLTCPENGEQLAYDLCRDGTKLAEGATAATFTAADSSQTLTLSLAEDAPANIPGTYKDTLTFTALIQ